MLAVALPAPFHNPPPHWVHQQPPCLQSSPPLLPVTAPPTGLDECFFFISLVVRLPCSSIFCQFWLFFVLKLLLFFFWLCEEAQFVYLCLHLGQKLPFLFLKVNLELMCSPPISALRASYCISFRTGEEWQIVYFCLMKNALTSSFLKESFGKYRILDWQSFSFSILIVLSYCLLVHGF